jgi:hypothetical protein
MDADQIIQHITIGRVDDHLADIATAIGRRITAADIGMRWRLTIPSLDLEISEDDLTLAEYATIKRTCGAGFVDLDIYNDPIHVRAVLQAVLVHRRDMQPEEAIDAVSKITAMEYAAGLETYQADPIDAGQDS